MNWPDYVVIMDDTPNASKLRDVLCDLSWIISPERFANKAVSVQEIKSLIESAHPAIVELAKLDNGHYFAQEERTKPRQIQTPKDVTDSFLLLQDRDSGSAMAFVDFDYSKASKALEVLASEYEKCPTEWKLASTHDDRLYETRGGYLFSWAFGPQIDPEIRLLCTSTEADILGLELLSQGAFVKCGSLRGTILQRMKVVLTALTKWVELQYPPITVRDLVKELVRAQFAGELPDPGHPHTPEQIPEDILLSSDLRSHLSSYSALYYIAEAERNAGYKPGYERRPIKTAIFCRLLDRAKIKVTSEKVTSELGDETQFQLPIPPGMLFIICLINFLEKMKISEVTLKQRNEGDLSFVGLQMSLDAPFRFYSGMMTGGSTGVKAFQSLLACRASGIFDGFTEDVSKDQLEIIKRTWPPQSLSGGTTPIYAPILKWEVVQSDKTLDIWWSSAVTPA